jgi:predicted metal-dependent hydrolase
MGLPPYAIRRSDRARQARIHVTADGIEVVVPRRLPLREVEPFVREKRPWIERTLRNMQEATPDAAGRQRDPLSRRRAGAVGRGRAQAHAIARGAAW